MNIQIIGRKKCQDSKKAERFFKERGVKFSKLDLDEKALSPGELRNICSRIPAEELVDKESKSWKQKYAYLVFDPAQEILEHPELIKTPIVRCSGKVSVGYDPVSWKAWLED